MKKLEIDLDVIENDFIKSVLLEALPQKCVDLIEWNLGKLKECEDELNGVNTRSLNPEGTHPSEVGTVALERLEEKAQRYEGNIEEWKNALEYLLEVGCERPSAKVAKPKKKRDISKSIKDIEKYLGK